MADELPFGPLEEALIRNWRTLSERDRMGVYRDIERQALRCRDPGPIPTDHLRPATLAFRRKLKSILARGQRG